MRSNVELGKGSFLHGERAVLTIPVAWPHCFEVGAVMTVDGTKYVVIGLPSEHELELRRLLPHDEIWLRLKFAWRGARRWLSRACARFRGARN